MDQNAPRTHMSDQHASPTQVTGISLCLVRVHQYGVLHLRQFLLVTTSGLRFAMIKAIAEAKAWCATPCHEACIPANQHACLAGAQ